MKKSYSAYPYAVWAILFTVIPLFMVLVYSVYDKNTGAFTLEYIKKCFEPAYLSIILNSFRIALICTFLCLVLGYPMALILSKIKSKGKNILLFLVIAPMWMNFLLRTYAWLTVLEKNGIINKFLGLFGIE
ncbi:MAG: ABC transporter permease, partial [Clostridia bacterium]|nr:ABC transporter permease [Clostridia bacterium]